MSLTKKFFLLAAGVLLFGAFAWAELTFSVQNVIDHANARTQDYNIAKIESAEGRICIEETIAAVSSGNYPESFKMTFGASFRLNNDGYGMSVIAHYCGGTL